MQESPYPAPILRTKLHRPAVAKDVLAQTRQIARLEQGRLLPLTLVSAPAGYGKSTLVSGWMEQSQSVGVWLTLDDGDNDPRVFLSHLVAALREEVPSIGGELLGAIGADDLPCSRVLATLLANELVGLDPHVVVVLDDYHRVNDTSVHRFIDHLLEHPPRGLHLVVVARRDPPLRTRSLRAKGQLTELRLNDLRLQSVDACEFLQLASGRAIADETASHLYRVTEGWPAGLRLAALALARRSDVEGLLEDLGGTLPHVQQYLVGEVLDGQPPEVQDYLRKTSIVEEMCAPLCEALGVRDDGTYAISGVEFRELLVREGLFVVPLDGRGEWYRYHHLFRDFLRIQLEAESTPAEIADLRTRAAHWLEGQGRLEQALRQYALSSEPAEGERALLRHRRALLDSENWHRIATCIHLIPLEVVDNSIDLQILMALSADRRGRYGEMEQALDRAEDLLASSPDEDSMDDWRRGQTEMMRAALLAHLAQGNEALQRSERALRLIPENALTDRAYALFILACALQMTGDRSRARRLLGEEIERHDHVSTAFQGRLLQALGLVEWMSADLTALRHTATAGLELGTKERLKETVAWSRFFLGAVQYHRGELEDVEPSLEPLATNRFGPSLHIHVLSVQVTALLEQARGNSGGAREKVDSLAEHLLEIGNESYRGYVEAFRADLAWRQGRQAEASRWAIDYGANGRWAGYHFSEPELTAAKLLLFEGSDGSLRRADELLEDLRTFYSSSHNDLFLIETLALQALHLEATGARDEATDRLGEAMAIALPGGFVRLFVDLGVALVPILHRLDLDEEGLRFVGRILAALQAETESRAHVSSGPSTQPSDLVEGLTPRELEILSLLAQHLTNKEIGERLFISPETVKHHIKNLYGKLAVHNRRDAVAKAQGWRILGDEPTTERVIR